MPLNPRAVKRTLSRQGVAAWLLLPALTLACTGKQADSPRQSQESQSTVTNTAPAMITAGGISVTQVNKRPSPEGTRLTLIGNGLNKVLRVQFGEYAGIDMRVKGDTELQVTVPRGADPEVFSLIDQTGSARIRFGTPVQNAPRPVTPAPAPAGPVTPAPAPAVPVTPAPALTGRMAHLGANLTPVERPWGGPGRCLEFPAARRTQQYGTLFLPQAPVIHPYSPWIDDDGSIREGFQHPEFALNLQLPGEFLEAVPPEVQEWLVQNGIKAEQVELFVVAQNQPWTAATPMLFRPHYWVYPDAPFFGTFSQETSMRVGLYPGRSYQVRLVDAATATTTAGISTHDTGPNTMILSSPNNLAISGLSPETSSSFWTMAALPNGRTAVTLHLLLDDSAQMLLEDISQKVNTLGQLFQAVNSDEALRSGAFDALGRLAGPVIHTIVTMPSPENPGMLLVQLEGSGFTGATRILGGRTGWGAPVATSDSRCHFLVPESEAQGSFALSGPLGGSESVALR